MSEVMDKAAIREKLADSVGKLLSEKWGPWPEGLLKHPEINQVIEAALTAAIRRLRKRKP